MRRNSQTLELKWWIKKKYISLSSFRLLEPVKTPEKDPLEYALATIVLLFDQDLKISHFKSCYDTITTVVERFLWLFRAATRPPYFEDSTGRGTTSSRGVEPCESLLYFDYSRWSGKNVYYKYIKVVKSSAKAQHKYGLNLSWIKLLIQIVCT